MLNYVIFPASLCAVALGLLLTLLQMLCGQ